MAAARELMMLPHFDGETFEAQDQERLASQLMRVKALMADHRWRTLEEIARQVGGSEASLSSRLRDCRKSRFGGHVVERRRLRGGLHQYRVLDPPEPMPRLF